MKVNVGDYVTLKSIKEVKPLYKKFGVYTDAFGRIDCAFAEDEFGKDTYYPHEMLNVDNKCIKDVYELTKVK